MPRLIEHEHERDSGLVKARARGVLVGRPCADGMSGECTHVDSVDCELAAHVYVHECDFQGWKTKGRGEDARIGMTAGAKLGLHVALWWWGRGEYLDGGAMWSCAESFGS